MDWNNINLSTLIVNDLSKEGQISLRDYLINLDKEKRKEWYKENSKYRNELKDKKYKENPEFKIDVYKRASETKTGMHYNMTNESKNIRNKKISSRYQNKSEEEKRLHMQKVSISQKERYKLFTEDDWKNKSEKQKQAIKNMPKDRREKILLNLKYPFKNKSKKELEQIQLKRINSIKLAWSKKSPEEINIILSNHIKKSKNNITDDGKRVDSSYEKDFYNYFLNLDIKLEHNVPIEYFYDNLKKRTYIDFKFNELLFECKGYHLLKGVFNYRGVPIEVKLDVYKNNNVILVTDTQGLEYCKNHNVDLNIITIDLFRSNLDLNIILNIIKRGGMNVI